VKKRILLISEDCLLDEIKNMLENRDVYIDDVSTLEEGFKRLLKCYYFLVVFNISFQEKQNMNMLIEVCQTRSVPLLIMSGIINPVHRIEVLKMMIGKSIELESEICERYVKSRPLLCSYMKRNKQCKKCYILTFNVDLSIDPISRQVSLNGEELQLTRKEFDLLFCLASHAGQVLSREQLYQMVWDENSAYNVDETVKAHIKSLRKKLTPAGAEYIKNVWGIGYRFSADENKEQS